MRSPRPRRHHARVLGTALVSTCALLGVPGAVAGLVTGGRDVGEAVVESADVDMVSFTGSEAVGRQVGKVVQSRFGKVLLELGGNNGACIH